MRGGGRHPKQSWSDTRLVQACLDGDGEAWTALLAKYKNLIYSIAIGYGASQADADDIFQTVCVEFFNGLPALRRVESLPAWLASVTRHRSFHWRRLASSRATREGTALEDAPPPRLTVVEDDVVERAQRDQRIREAIDRLPARCRRLVHLLFFEQPPRPYADIAGEMGLALGSIAMIRARCLKKLQSEIHEAGL